MFNIYQNPFEYTETCEFFRHSDFLLYYVIFELVLFNNTPRLSPLTNASPRRISKKLLTYVCLPFLLAASKDCTSRIVVYPLRMYFKRNKILLIKGFFLGFWFAVLVFCLFGFYYKGSSMPLALPF